MGTPTGDGGGGSGRWSGRAPLVRRLPTTTVWDSIESVIAIHGHHGATEVEWYDPDPDPDPGSDPDLDGRADLRPQPWPDLHAAPEPDDTEPADDDLDGRADGHKTTTGSGAADLV